MDERWRAEVHPAKGGGRSRGRIKPAPKFFLEITPMSLMGPEKKKKTPTWRRKKEGEERDERREA